MVVKTENIPAISVIMPVFNSQDFLKDSIESVLGQTLRDFEFIIIDDGSTDNGAAIISGYKTKDDRIVIIKNESNVGITKSLNIGLKAARGRYIARMDADDISFKDRFEKQFEYMERRPEIGVLGSYVKSVNMVNGKTGRWLYPLDPLSVKWHLIFSNALAHPSVMFRRELALSSGGYDEKFINGQDYDLWARLSERTDIRQIPEFLTVWRNRPSSMTSKNAAYRKAAHISISRRQIEKYLGKDINGELAGEVYNMESGLPASSAGLLEEMGKLIEELKSSFISKNPQISVKFAGKLASKKLLKLALANLLYYPAVSVKILMSLWIRNL